jgi:hypothetical protein
MAMLRSFVMFSALAVASGTDISPNCKPYPQKRVVLLSINSEYIDFFVNWYHHAKNYLTANEQLVVMASDADSEEMLHELQGKANPSFEVLSEGKPIQSQPVSFLQFSSVSQVSARITAKHPARILEFLKSGCTVLYNDVDTAWMKNVLNVIDRVEFRDMLLTDDTPSNRMKSLFVPNWYLSTNLMYMQPTQPLINVIEKWVTGSETAVRVQPLFNTILKEDFDGLKTVNFELLPFEQFPPGKIVEKYPEATVVHANYRRSHDEKVSLLQSTSAWVLWPKP